MKKATALVLLVCILFVGMTNCFAVSLDIDHECGENATWDINNRVLTISGTGKMYDYNYSSDTPWYSWRSIIDSIIIESGITTIGNKAFAYLTFSTITIPKTVTSIGEGSFQGSTFDTITLPEGVTLISSSAFYNSDIKSIYLPLSLEGIRDYAFSGCGKLTHVYYAGTKEKWDKISIHK